MISNVLITVQKFQNIDELCKDEINQLCSNHVTCKDGSLDNRYNCNSGYDKYNHIPDQIKLIK